MSSVDTKILEIEPNVDNLPSKIDCKRAYSCKMLGLSFDIRSYDGAAICDLSSVVSRLKQAAMALRTISAKCASSAIIHLVKTYIVSIMSYGIVVWYPNLFQYLNSPDQSLRRKAFADWKASCGSSLNVEVPMSVRCKTTNSLSEIRYWYFCCQAYICHHEKSILGWTNSSRSVLMDSSIEAKLRVLTGLPSLEELYVSSCLSHYSHFAKMAQLKIENHGVGAPRRTADSSSEAKSTRVCRSGIQKQDFTPENVD